jgi:hypothetical protein
VQPAVPHAAACGANKGLVHPTRQMIRLGVLLGSARLWLLLSRVNLVGRAAAALSAALFCFMLPCTLTQYSWQS